ncbi:MAG: hypothetical protein JWN53_437 [Gemmatimonadetes bacterium]|jgi:hypothetical protein|nr:hypothetical protein [Gemmatimonadota bacterium]
MRRTNWKTISTLVTMAVLAGCQDNIATPVATPSAAPAEMSLAPAGRPTLSLSAQAAGSTTTDFTVGPNGGTFIIGNAAVVFPANSICDPEKSTYGITTWDDQCAVLRKPLTIHAVASTTNGQVAVDFSPSLRFKPSTNASKWVWMYFHTPAAVNTMSLATLNILYYPEFGGRGYDESLSDPTLRTYVDTRTGTVVRRIKHFSGYAVLSGGDCQSGCDSQ